MTLLNAAIKLNDSTISQGFEITLERMTQQNSFCTCSYDIMGGN